MSSFEEFEEFSKAHNNALGIKVDLFIREWWALMNMTDEQLNIKLVIDDSFEKEAEVYLEAVKKFPDFWIGLEEEALVEVLKELKSSTVRTAVLKDIFEKHIRPHLAHVNTKKHQ